MGGVDDNIGLEESEGEVLLDAMPDDEVRYDDLSAQSLLSLLSRAADFINGELVGIDLGKAATSGFCEEGFFLATDSHDRLRSLLINKPSLPPLSSKTDLFFDCGLGSE